MTPDPNSASAYEILGVARDADAEAIRYAYRKLAMRYHPDMVPEGEKAAAAKVFTRFNTAYEVINDPESRARYDRLLDRGITPDLDKMVGDEPPVRSLGEILGEIQALDLEDAELDLLEDIDSELRNRVVWPSLFRGAGLVERIIDVVRFSKVK